MRALDIDLDVFVSPIENIHSSTRLKDDDCELMRACLINQFLHEKCGLNTDTPLPGLVFEEHDELFDAMKYLIGTEQLKTPFELVHVDAHADLGAGQWDPFEYLLGDLMHKAPQDRTDPKRGSSGLNRGTVTLFIAACEWISKLHYVHHPEDGEDIPNLLRYEDGKSEQEWLQIPTCPQNDMNRIRNFMSYQNRWEALSSCCSIGKAIPLELESIDSCSELGKFDFVFLTRSPGFTPPKADKVFAQIQSYIRPIEIRQ